MEQGTKEGNVCRRFVTQNRRQSPEISRKLDGQIVESNKINVLEKTLNQ